MKKTFIYRKITAVFIGLGVGFAVGSKEIFANIGGYVQSNKILKIGSRITVDGKYTGKIQQIGHYTTTILADNGERIIIPNSQLVKSLLSMTGEVTLFTCRPKVALSIVLSET